MLSKFGKQAIPVWECLLMENEKQWPGCTDRINSDLSV